MPAFRASSYRLALAWGLAWMVGSALAQTANGVSEAGLPYALRQITGRFPVTLYSSDTCEPCASGRALLRARGVPFQERSVNTPDDLTAYQRISGGSTLPLLTIGQQQLKGFSASEWTQYLDAAGYPSTPSLPRNYRWPEATPLAPAPREASPAVQPRSAPVAVPPPAPVVTPDNPAGIRF